MNEDLIPPGWVGFRHVITGEVRAINPYNVDEIKALKAEKDPRHWDRSAWEQIPLPTRTRPWDWRESSR